MGDPGFCESWVSAAVNEPKKNATAPRPKGINPDGQVACTPPEFLDNVRLEFGPHGMDLAASHENAVAPIYFTRYENALEQDWVWPRCYNAGGSYVNTSYSGSEGTSLLNLWRWLNPPFADIEPWAQKCHEESLKGARIHLLVPASVDSRWFSRWVYGKAQVRFLVTRISFITTTSERPDGKREPYPKPLMLCVFDVNRPPTLSVWDWKKSGDLMTLAPAINLPRAIVAASRCERLAGGSQSVLGQQMASAAEELAEAMKEPSKFQVLTTTTSQRRENPHALGS